jgi:hypothetical protein
MNCIRLGQHTGLFQLKNCCMYRVYVIILLHKSLTWTQITQWARHQDLLTATSASVTDRQS